MSVQSTPPQKSYQIVVGLDLLELSDRAFMAALELANAHPKAEIHAIIVGEARGELIRLPHQEEIVSEENARKKSCDHVADLVRRYEQSGGRAPVERIGVYVTTGDAASQIVDLGRAVDSDVIVVGTRGRRGAELLLLGSVAQAVVRTAPCGVYIVRPADFIGDKKVPSIEPPLKPGEPHLKHFAHRRTYHYVDRNSEPPPRMLPVA